MNENLRGGEERRSFPSGDRDPSSGALGPQPLLTSTEAAELLDVHPSTVKRWCNRGALPHSVTPGGHRRIRLTSVTEFARASGIPTILSTFHPYEAHAWDALSRARDDGDFQPLHALAMGWIDRGRLDRVVRLFEALAGLPSVSLCCFLDEALRGFMVEVGRSWREGLLRVGEEHLISQGMIEVLYGIRERRRREGTSPRSPSDGEEGRGQGAGRPPSNPSKGLAVVGSTEENQHHLGALGVRILLEELGWEVLYLGPGVPAEEFAVLQRSREAGLVCVSMASPVTPGSIVRLLGVLAQFYDRARPYALALGGDPALDRDDRILEGPFRRVAFFEACAPFHRALEEGWASGETGDRKGGEVRGSGTEGDSGS